MSYRPVRCPNGCGDLPVRIRRDGPKLQTDDPSKTILTVMCKKCRRVIELTGKELGCKVPD